MIKLYYITNNLPAPTGYPYLRRWFCNNQAIYIGNTLLKLTARKPLVNAAFDLHVLLKNKNKIAGFIAESNNFIELTKLDLFIAIRAAEYVGGNIPSRLLVDFITINKHAKLSIVN